MSSVAAENEAPSDAELISRVRAGDVAAYGDLFERHRDAAQRMARQLVRGPDVDDLISEAFTKVLVVLQRGSGPDVAFRAYLLTAIRRLHVDKARAGQRVQVTDDLDTLDRDVEFADPATASFERGAAARAFASLPERWQLVLWHLEVEEQKPAEIAPLLGMSANSVAALAYRAREGLRQAYLQSHLADTAEDSCRWTTEHLGAYVRGGLAKRDSGKVSGHLEDCRRCTAVYLELGEVNSNLSGLLGPAILGAAAPGYLAAAGGTKLWVLLLMPWTKLKDAGTSVQAGAAAAAVGAVVAVAAAAGLIGGGDEPSKSADPPSSQQAPDEPPPDDSAPPENDPPDSEPKDEPPAEPTEDEPPEEKPDEDPPDEPDEPDEPDKSPPDAPTEFDGDVSGAQVTLRWSPVPGVRGYRVYRSAENAASSLATTIAMSAAVSSTVAAPGDVISGGIITETSFRDRSLVDGQRYRYVVTSVDGGDESRVSKPVTVTYDPEPGEPVRLRADERGSGISVQWKPNAEPDIDGYRVYRDGRPVGGTTTGNQLVDRDVTDGDSYEYSVASVDRGGQESDRSDAVAATYDPSPGAPSDVTAKARADDVALRWDGNPEPDIDAYRVYRDGDRIATTGSPRLVDDEVTDGTTYAYTVVAVDRAGQQSPQSARETATYDPVPESPVNLDSSVGDGTIELSWRGNTEPDLDGYIVLRDGEPVTDPIGSTSYTDTDVEDGTTYRYTVVAVDRSGNESEPSGSVREAWDPAPAAPAGLAAEEQDDGIALSWTANAEPDLRTYRVYRNGTAVATVDEPSYLDTEVTDGTAYAYRVVAIDRSGQVSKRSEPVEGCYDPRPDAPTGLTARVHGHSVTLTWDANGEPDILAYNVYRDGSLVTTVHAPHFVDPLVVEDTSYQVTAVDADGQESPLTPSVDADVPPSPPTGLVAVEANAAIELSWEPSAGAEGYVVLRGGTPITGVIGPTRFTDRNVIDGTVYAYTVVAVDAGGNRSDPSNTVTGSWDPAPSLPIGLNWKLNGETLTLSWAANPEPDVDHYEVFLDHDDLGPVYGTSVDQGSHTGTATHTLKVTAVDDGGNRSQVAELRFTHPDGRISSFRVSPDADDGPRQAPQRQEDSGDSLDGFTLR